jgi:hypothetical protein
MIIMAEVGIGAEFERTTEMKSENESENDHFCKSEGRVQFFKNDYFWFIFISISLKNEIKNEIKNESKMA